MKNQLPDEHFETNKEITIEKFFRREYSMTHLTYENEFRFYQAVKEGDEKEVKRIMMPLDSEKMGKLSPDPVRNMRYHLIVTISLVTRFCIEGGLSPEDAYTMSDIYIQKADAATSVEAIEKLHQQVVFAFTRKMKEMKKSAVLSKPVMMAIDYIYDHLQEKITLAEIADACCVSKNYLCGLFKKEMDLTILGYIHKKKLEAAQNMLLYSDYSSTEISNYLCFASHSHFITLFKNETGMTPKEYREMHYRAHFSSIT